jgi:hypothetical protein
VKVSDGKRSKGFELVGIAADNAQLVEGGNCGRGGASEEVELIAG